MEKQYANQIADIINISKNRDYVPPDINGRNLSELFSLLQITKETAQSRHTQCVRIPVEVISPGILLTQQNIMI